MDNVFLITFMFTVSPISAFEEFKHKGIHVHDCEENDDFREDEEEYHPDYEQLGEYKDLYLYFEEQIMIDESFMENETMMAKGLSLFKWGKKLKNWFKKRTANLFVDMLNLKKYKNKEYCAYKAAKFKRKIDKYCSTGTIDEVFSRCDDLLQKQSNELSMKNPESDLRSFKERVRYYHDNRKAKPKKSSAHNDKGKENELKKYSLKAVIGGLEIFAGTLIYFLPFPGCQACGGFLVGHGLKDVLDGMVYEDPQDAKQKNYSKPKQSVNLKSSNVII